MTRQLFATFISTINKLPGTLGVIKTIFLSMFMHILFTVLKHDLQLTEDRKLMSEDDANML